jgi:Zn-dependent peptidase ImmA (M78 family)/DNA-binding XRE family transcriptional regulator
VGEQLKAAREARGIISASALADMLSVSRAAVSQYESGKQTPSPEVMRSISTVLNLPIQHFLRRRTELDGLRFFRSLSSATQGMRVRARRKCDWLAEIVTFLRGHLQFPKVDFPQLGLPDDPLKISTDMVEQAALDLRHHWGLGHGPISNVAWLAENKGAITVRLDLDSDKLDAFSHWNEIDETPYIILGTNKGTAPRSRFNAAHEIAHMVLHRNVNQSQFARPAVFNEMERQANRFAGAFLLPHDTFLSDMYLVSLDAMKSLKPKWKVSIALMLKRAEDLGAISEERVKPLWINLARRGWKRQEPMDTTLPTEEPRFLQRCFAMLIEKRLVRREEFPLQLSLNYSDIQELANLPTDFFGPIDETHDVQEVEPAILRFPRRA